MPHEDVGRLNKQDIEEHRAKCAVCSQELTYIEFFFYGDRCIWHTDRPERAENMPLLRYISLVWHDLQVLRGKARMKARGLTHVDYQACINTVAEDLRFIDNTGDMKKLVSAMKEHTGQCTI